MPGKKCCDIETSDVKIKDISVSKISDGLRSFTIPEFGKTVKARTLKEAIEIAKGKKLTSNKKSSPPKTKGSPPLKSNSKQDG